MTNTIRIAGIVEESIVDGPGIRLVVFVQGCKHKCPGCHNVHTHAFDGGEIISVKNIIDKIKENPLLDGITLSGGEPFEQAKILSKLAKEVKDLGYNVMTYTGYTYEQIVKSSSDIYGWSELLENTDILVDGKFDVQKKNLKLRFKGSENQRIIDVKETKLNNKIVFADI
ncbi:anaerobic ribonucleoside-triphosphate reductase activating protein NrdG [Gottschalkia acidurici 9a]|uniref:Anaerobic ribonucleoside-triphosphate reductase-activating protein n=1 Tax=Gottschalkia acidurici (strain ATCC 7906 / DSM 604 / BCRC 14475 / CIP 104303 / KCTC 5404 / NCIMB 10678 / 9a) TaxID=1128398 RepID=K0AZU1_GOTA9|nr:anaerobic ribonucleoside-triphosphate reductase activating protein [Gottschalkia acidurici]AFS78794.1 anaerobic ribonucleoside-triphosphate reductase activating protein NrdG [Gottschalkia acidurici 9a]